MENIARLERQPESEVLIEALLREGYTLTLGWDAGEDGPDGYPSFFHVDATEPGGERVPGGCSVDSLAAALEHFAECQRVRIGRFDAVALLYGDTDTAQD